MSQPSLYEMLTGNFSGGLGIHQVSEENQVILSVLDNIQRIINTRAGTLAHLPDYGLPDMSKIMQGLPGTAHSLINILSSTLLKYEPRIKRLSLTLLPEHEFGTLRYALEAELHEVGLVRYGTEFIPGGRVLIRHLKKQNFLESKYQS
ncbi:type VI secretion system baseplate subunit TssE [Xenorhabdus stockiae]|uniref:type VI secretion system baseplate subunit TssE n=1 Tax=Xenorhabdus stockiae TaxID=351614 RepID=UPI0040634237